ncbi:long-chain-fatty-acid--CoA ligase [bacterium]|nr:long-chain-fatty-acid--CoA ligase [bacterium]
MTVHNEDHAWTQYYASDAPTKLDFSTSSSVASTIEAACRRFANNPAVTAMDTTLTYRQLDRLANRFAAFLQHEIGLKKGDRLAIMMPNVLQFPIAFLAAQKIGVICVNTNPLYTPREMRHQFSDSGATAIVIMDLFLDKLEEILKETGIKHVISTSIVDQLPAWKGFAFKAFMRFKKIVPKHNLKVHSFRKAISTGDESRLERPELGLDDIALLQYTGGTTGISKGAMLTQRNILANMQQIRHAAWGQVEEGAETVLTALPLYHIFALTVNFLSFLAMGEHLILVPKPVPISNTVKIFKKYNITVMTGVNTLYNSISNDKEFKRLGIRSIKFALAGGMALQESVAKAWQLITGNRIVEGFGLTESSPVTHVNPLGQTPRTGSIGVPVLGTDARVVNDKGETMSVGEPGELIIKGPQVMAGYWQRPDETSNALKDGWLLTGDIAKIDQDGYFFIVDRKKDMILVSGFNVYPNEIEEVIASHPKVLEAAVVGLPDASTGESVNAFVVPKDPGLTIEELRTFCRDQLTGYKRPRHIEIRSSLPKTNVGKILRRELRDEALAKKAPRAQKSQPPT